MEVAVTGGSGRLGRWVIQRLLKEGDTVRSLDVLAPVLSGFRKPSIAPFWLVGHFLFISI